MTADIELVSRVRRELGGRSDDLPKVESPHSVVPLPSRLATAALAWASVCAASLAAGRNPSEIDVDRVALSYRSERVLTIDGITPPVWSPFSGFWRTGDGWVRTHGNYPHHAAALRAGLHLGVDAGARELQSVLSTLTSAEATTAIVDRGGLAVTVRREDAEADAARRRDPLLAVHRLDSSASSRDRSPGAGPLPLSGIRVLDLTRVIAGPVCTRTLALLGADVLRIDPPGLPEPEWQHYDTGHGKRSTVLDARSTRMHELLAEADAVVLGYRPSSLARLGLTADELHLRHPGLVVAELSAWGIDEPDRAGFDSLVQAESGISLIESPDGEQPGALPAQALDHSAGYLLAAAVTTLLRRRSVEGGSWQVQTSLRRIAAELLGMPRRTEPDVESAVDLHEHVARFRVDGRDLVTARPALPGVEFSAPRPWGADQPRW